ncbi:MAG TPA: hypothetical protein PK323_02470 [Bacteroidia bacterium]|nr:hypothetical protein [Bacteroidia bacterium]
MMKNTYRNQLKNRLAKIVFLLVIIFLSTNISVLAQDKLGVIGNAKGVPTAMSEKELKTVMKGEKQRWGDGTKIVIALMKTNTPIGQNTSKRIYNMTGDELNRFWLALVFQGKTSAPTFFNSMNELESFVAQTPGAIGIVQHTSSNEGKLIAVDGKKDL